MVERVKIGGRILVVFDGTCGFCQWSVRWLIKRDRKDRLRFVAFGDERVARVLEQHGIPLPEPNGGSVVVVRGYDGGEEMVLLRSDAVVEFLGQLPAPWPMAGGALAWVPRVVRDWGYGLVARWRHKVQGRMGSCALQTAEERERFL